MIGPTGSGKTFWPKPLARSLNVPFAIADATALTEAGYVGRRRWKIFLKLLQAADFNIERAERGIIYVDEIDKIAKKKWKMSLLHVTFSGEGCNKLPLWRLSKELSLVYHQAVDANTHNKRWSKWIPRIASSS